MAVFRVIKDKENPYVMINKYFVYDGRLSLKAKGLMSYFLSRPDNWEFYQSEILKHCTDKKDSLASSIKELEKTGYIKRFLKRDSKGKLLGGYDFNVFEIPEEIKETEKASTQITESGLSEIGKNRNREKPISENPPLLNNDIKLNNDIELNKETTTTTNNGSCSSKGNINVFNHFEKCNFGLLSPMLMEKIATDIEIYGQKWVMKAAEVSDEQGKHSYAYVKGILSRWKTNGGDNFGNHSPKQNNGKSKKWEGYKPPKPKTTEEIPEELI